MTNQNKKTITESQLKNVIAESVVNILKEYYGGYKDGMRGYQGTGTPESKERMKQIRQKQKDAHNDVFYNPNYNGGGEYGEEGSPEGQFEKHSQGNLYDTSAPTRELLKAVDGRVDFDEVISLIQEHFPEMEEEVWDALDSIVKKHIQSGNYNKEKNRG